jgi:hypothetical protein
MTLFKTLQLIHIAGGTTSLLLGIIVLSLKKGNKRHKWLGNIYFYAMLIASIVAIPMSYLHPNYFLFIVAIFTIYMLLTGYRYLSKKKIEDVSYIDWLSNRRYFSIWICLYWFWDISYSKARLFWNCTTSIRHYLFTVCKKRLRKFQREIEYQKLLVNRSYPTYDGKLHCFYYCILSCKQYCYTQYYRLAYTNVFNCSAYY